MPFVDFTGIEDYASNHPRAARYLASINKQKAAKDIDKRALKAFCKRTNVRIQEKNRKLTVEKDEVMAFLEVLDRRRYEVKLVKGVRERFRAGSRQKLGT